ncbi:MAG: glycosyltransferase [Methanobacteriaceae archaeon]|nr:glycosyltransferase [Methanobacteriaceae archaeon]
MSLKSFISKSPFLYILLKSPNLKIAKLNFKAYNIIKKNILFDEDFYLSEYKNLEKLKIDPILHYIFFGFNEGKDPSPNFDSLFYLNEYEDVKPSKLNPLVHYTLYGLKKNRKTRINDNFLSLESSEIEDILLKKNFFFNNKNDKKRVLYILHEKINVLGGTGYINQDIINIMDEKYETFILSLNINLMELWKVSNNNFKKISDWKVDINKPAIIHDYHSENSSNELKDYFYNKELRNIYFNVIYNLKIDFIHINHLINHSYDLIDMIKFFKIPYIINIHDFYYFCPSIHLLNKKDNYCSVRCLKNSWDCKIAQNTEKIIHLWRNYTLKAINESDLAIFPSEYCLNFYENNFEGIKKEKLFLISPGRDFKRSSKNYTKPNNFPVKILFLGHISPHKGSLFIKEIKKLDKKNNLDFHFLGTTIPNLNQYGINHGRYDRNELDDYLSDIKPSFIGLFSICPETYSHTLTESWNSNIPVIGTNLGAFKERINKTGGGWLINHESPKKAYDEIIKISENKEDYLKVIENISNIKFKSKKEMGDEYKRIYNDLIED